MQQCYLLDTYDSVHACDYVDPNHYGICWVHEWRDKETCVLRMRVIDLTMSTMIGIVGIEMERVGESYRISRLYDLRETDEQICGLLEDLAFEQVRESDRYTMKPDVYMKNEVLIEKIEEGNVSYFSSFVSLYDKTKRVDGRVSGGPVYAVTVNTLMTNFGYITWYFQLTNSALVSETTPPQFAVLGYDPMFPMSTETFDGIYYNG